MDIRGIGIYAIVNDGGRAAYIGATLKGFHERWLEHQAALLKGNHLSSSLQADWVLLGRDAFRIMVLEIITDEELLRAREQYWIDHYQAGGYAMYNTARAQARPAPERPDEDRGMSTADERSEAGRRLAALKPRYLATCQVCDQTFEGTAAAVYCSTRCRVRAWRAAKRETAPAPLRPASPLDVSLERTHALQEAEWARRDGDLAEARRWEQQARDLAAGAERVE